MVATACGSSPQHSSSSKASTTGAPHGTITFAIDAEDPPDYIFPLFPPAHYDNTNTALIQQLMYRPLYWPGSGAKPEIDEALSLAYPPTYSNGNRTVTIKLKSYRWSDGKPVTSRDVEFWINLLRADKTEYGPYIPGTFPDNVASFHYPNSRTIVMDLKETYNPAWFSGTALTEITPMPQHAWDKTSTQGKVGNYDMTTKGAQAVYKYLNGQSDQLHTYATNPLWKVVDGPWQLQQFTLAGKIVFTPNKRYSGPIRPKIAKFVELPFTSPAAEFNALRGGLVDYGSIPVSDVKEIPTLKGLGYTVAAWPNWGVNYLYTNYTNPKSGPLVKQLYIRQAMEHLINQPEYIKTIFHGYAYPTYGPIPVEPTNRYESPSEAKNPYPYDPAAARHLLSEHGWHVVPNGVSTCEVPSKCGPGIKKGTPLSFTDAIYPSELPEVGQMMQAIESTFAENGIRFTVKATPGGEIGGLLVPCKPGKACPWEFIDFNTAYYWQPYVYPDGGFVAGTANTTITGFYSSKMDALVQATRTSSGTGPLYRYENYVSRVMPNLWIPVEVTQVSVIKNSVKGALPQNPIGAGMTPEAWSLSG